MFITISFQNFKSWKDTGEIELAPITGFFGTNSSGKSSILQFLLMLKQTMESTDNQRVLNTGDEHSYVELGTIDDISYQHNIPNTMKFTLAWDSSGDLNSISPDDTAHFSWNSILFSSIIQLEKDNIFIDYMNYLLTNESMDNQGFQFREFTLKKKPKIEPSEYEMKTRKYQLVPYPDREVPPLPAPIKNYGFPSLASWCYQNTSFLSDLVLAYEKVFQTTYYLGPLRDYPKRTYSWSGEKPQGVGRRGEFAIPALLASRKLSQLQYGDQTITIEERIAIWLKELGLIDSFSVQPIAEGRQEYEVRVRRSPNASEVLITDVGFGVSQILPVLVLCYYVPEGSTIIFEQPEIHLHPSVQAGLADVFIDAMKTRKVQIILESHSEHLLHRLQRRIAEEKDGLTNQDVKLYFCNSAQDGSSNLTALQIDPFGNIANWPENFFGDEMGDLFAMTEAAMKRQMVND
jgi:AAA15 family ATPase/GTPase